MPTSLYNFQYVPLTGRLPGKSFVSQTEQAINGLAQYVYENSTNYEAVKAIAQKAEEDSSSALEYSEEALDKAQTALETVGRAYIKTTSAVDLDDYYDSELLLILSTESANLPANISGYLTVMSSDTHDYCMQVYVGIDGSVYKRTATIPDNTPTFGAWSETPITMSSLQTILADYAKVDASNIGVNAQTDNSTAWGNAIGGGGIANGEQRLITGGTVYPLSVDVDIAQKDIANIKALLQGHLYNYQTDTNSAYTKSVPAGAMPYAGIEKVGGKTVVMNQLFPNPSTTYTGNGNAAFNSGTSFIAGHKYFCKFDYTYSDTPYWNNGATVFARINGNNVNVFLLNIQVGAKAILTANYSATSNGTASATEGNCWTYVYMTTLTSIYNINYIDLTLMFGPGNEPSTVAEFEAMFPAESYPHNEGTLLSAGVTEVVSKGKNLINEANVYNFTNIQYEGGVFTNTATDTKTTFALILQYAENGSYMGTIVGQNATTIGIASVTFTARLSCNQLNVGHNGSVKDFKVAFYADIVAGKTYTLSINVISNIANQVGGVQFNDVMLEESETATSYAPYMTPIQYPIPAEVQALTGYGWSAGSVYNEIDFERKVFIKRVGTITLNGSESWRFDSSNVLGMVDVADVFRIGLSTQGTKLTFNNNPEMPDSSWTGRNQNTSCLGNYWNANAIYAKNPSITDAITAKAYFTAHPTIVNYVLDTPVEIDISEYITDDDLIQVESGGTITFENQNGTDYQIPVPSEETYMIDLQEAINNG